MPKPQFPAKNNATAQPAARQTDSGWVKAAAVGDDPAALKIAHTEAPAAAVPFNAMPASNLPAGSTLSEKNTSDKTGDLASLGASVGISSLAGLRSDATGQMLTTHQGMRISDNQNSLKFGARGPALLEDFGLREKITHVDHGRVPERTVHACGSGAHGYFESYGLLGHLTKAALFKEAGKITPVFVRFSNVAGERGFKDAARDVLGFAVKFYTDEGNWDLVGNNRPVLFIQDAVKLSDLAHAVKPDPHRGMPQAASAHGTFWDFVSPMPESTHMLMQGMSDRAIARSYATMQGFGVHTHKLVNEAGEVSLVKFHWKPKFDTHSPAWDKAVKISGADPDHHRRDLWERIESGAHPEWELGFQRFTEEQAEAFSFDILDATKIVPEELVPVQKVGRMVLNRNPDNFFAETEQAAFCVSHVVPGIDVSNDPLLAERIHAHIDTQISRLGGPNCHEIPINAPLAPVHNNQRDGTHRQGIPRGVKTLPGAMPKALEQAPTPEVTQSHTLSLKASLGDGSIAARKVAILVAPGIVGQTAFNVHAALFAQGASPRFVGPHTGAIETADGVALEADASFENEPGFLFDGLVLPDGADGVGELAAVGPAMDFVTDQYRHAKPILVMGASAMLLDQAGIAVDLPGGQADPGIVIDDGTGDSTQAFIQALAAHRHPQRETDSPVV